MVNPIVTVKVTETVAPTPSLLQKTGALISQGGTSTAAGTKTLLTQLADLQDILGTGASADELEAMATTFFAQGSQVAVYVLELGAGSAASAITALGNYIANSPQFFYAYLVPKAWADAPSYLTFLAGFESLTAKTYFFTTMSVTNYTTFGPTNKCVVGMVPAPGTPPEEFSLAAAFHVALNYDPSATNRVTPYSFSYLFGVTPWDPFQSSSTLNSIKDAGVNYVGTGAEGGISNTILFWGTTMDKNDYSFWYSVDWVQINGDLSIANAIINGSNNPQNPLYYNQDGINRLQAVVVAMMGSGISFGLVLGVIAQTQLTGSDFQKVLDSGQYAGKALVNAQPFIPYSKEHPGDYKIGKYSGLTVAYVPARGFIQIVFNINVSQFVTT